MKSSRGFTLIEVMIVLAIIAGVIVLGAPRIFKASTNIKSVARHLVVLTKETRNKARLNNVTYRLVFDLKEEGTSYWAEKGQGPQAVDLESLRLSEEEKDQRDEEAPPPPFSMDTSLLKQPKTLPTGIKIVSIETINSANPIREGKAYIYYSAQGFVEASAIQIANAQNQIWTLVINPVTGQADIVEKATSLKDLER
ncbi:MAG: Tfp pilus assembly protein FimT/FimU [Bdellovibrionia bacterium]